MANSANQGQNTPVDAVPQIAAWNPEGTTKAGVMLWNLNQPTLAETQAGARRSATPCREGAAADAHAGQRNHR